MVRFTLGVSLSCLLVACGSNEEPQQNAADIANIVENIAELPEPPAEEAATPPPMLEPLSRADIEANLESGAGCDFSPGGDPLFVSAGATAIAKVNGRIARFTAQSPIGPTGGFYTAGTLRLSIGRTSETGNALDEVTSWPARLSLTDRATDAAPLMVGGTWRCGA